MKPRVRIVVSFLDDDHFRQTTVLSTSPKLEEIHEWCMATFGHRVRMNGHFHNYTNPSDNDQISGLFYHKGNCMLFDFTNPDHAMLFKLAWG